MQNTAGKCCVECGSILDQSPSNRNLSSLVCLNERCGKWRQPQGAIACDNNKFFDTPNNIGGKDAGNHGVHRHIKTSGAYGDM